MELSAGQVNVYKEHFVNLQKNLCRHGMKAVENTLKFGAFKISKVENQQK